VFFVYVDWTLEAAPRPFYVGKGICSRVAGLRRNRKHTRIAKNYGFRRETIWSTSSESEALAYEIQLVEFFGTFTTDWKNGVECNFTLGGDGCSGRKASEKTIQKLRAKRYSTESKQRMSIAQQTSRAQKKRKYRIRNTSQTIAKIKAARKKQTPPCLGKRFSVEHRESLSKSLRGKIVSDETRKKMSDSAKKRNRK